jgi:hypothetical protein
MIETGNPIVRPTIRSGREKYISDEQVLKGRISPSFYKYQGYHQP